MHGTPPAAGNDIKPRDVQDFGNPYQLIQPADGVTVEFTWRHRGHIFLLTREDVLCRKIILISRRIPDCTALKSKGVMTLPSSADIT
jgi:hypothetical protein